MTSHCTTSSSVDDQEQELLKVEPPEGPSLQNVTSIESRPASSSPSARGPTGRPLATRNSTELNTTSTTKSVTNMNTCRRLIQRFVTPYKELAKVAGWRRLSSQQPPCESFLDLSDQNCESPAERARVVKTIRSCQQYTDGRIVFLVRSTAAGGQPHELLHGLQAAMGQHPIRTRILVKEYDPRSLTQPAGIEQVLAPIALEHGSPLIIAEGPFASHVSLSRWAESLMIPVISLTATSTTGASSPWFSNIFPDPMRMMDALARTARTRAITKVGILRPSAMSADLLEAFRKSFAAHSMAVVQEAVYENGQFESLERAIKTLFKLDDPNRDQELADMKTQASARAEADGKPIDLSQIHLKALADFDALFLPDDFRTMRYTMRLLKYHEAPQLVFMGIQAWRSRPLVEPFEARLEGAFFVDYVGDYTTLPQALRSRDMKDGRFPEPAEAQAVDIRMIGYRSGQTLTRAFQGPIADRYTLAKKLSQDEQEHPWPSYIFKLSRGTIMPGPPDVHAPAAARTR